MAFEVAPDDERGLAMRANRASLGSSYPVSYDVEPQGKSRNRVTTAFRLILGAPHTIVIGGLSGVGFGFGGLRAAGALATAAFTMAFISWFAIVFAHKHPRGLWEFATYYLRWWVRARTSRCSATIIRPLATASTPRHVTCPIPRGRGIDFQWVSDSSM